MSEVRPEVEVAFVWHMHQPPYQIGDETPVLPWVRLHAVKAYYDMAWILLRYPAARAVFNFTPSLLLQLTDIVEHGVRDAWFQLSLRPAHSLSRSERAFVLQHFFSLSWTQAVEKHPTYMRLLQRRGRQHRGVVPDAIVDRFSTQDILNLQALFNLYWLGFGARAEFPELLALMAQESFDERDKQRVLDIHIEVAGRVLPLYRELHAAGQCELTTTPLNHPILPLLCDTNAAVQRAIDRPLPPRFSWPEDAAAQVAQGIAVFERTFGYRPKGMWPAEGSVSDAALAVIAQHGIEWVATDRQILMKSLGAAATTPDAHTWAWTVEASGDLAVLFRDTEISDLIGFQYRNSRPERAAADMLARLTRAAGPVPVASAPPLVTVVLDGENPWEHYEDDGRHFLQAFYTALGAQQRVRSVLPADRMWHYPPRRRLRHIHSGSWIEADFHIWIGHPVKNEAWRLLGVVRETLSRAIATHTHAEADVNSALEAIYRAEASDWFWWFGPYFNSDQDAIFDELFRRNLRAALTRLDLPVPDELGSPIEEHEGGKEDISAYQPTAAISPSVDGDCRRYLDWLGAGRYTPAGTHTAMFQHGSVLRDTWFGRDRDALYFRFDLDRARLRRAEQEFEIELELRAADGRHTVEFASVEPSWLRLLLATNAATAGSGQVSPLDSVSLKRSLVLSVPHGALKVSADEPLRWAARCISSGIEVARVPHSGFLELPGLAATIRRGWFL